MINNHTDPDRPGRGRTLRIALAAGLLAGVAACSTPGPDHPPDQPFDPYEAGNRDAHEFNRGLDRVLVRPVSRGYSNVMPDDIETAISRFATNLSIPQAVVNNMLQGNMRGAIEDTSRFVVNTTVGLGGFFDPASELGMKQATEADFGKTLQVWGVPQGAYLEIPVLGPSSERAFAGDVVDLFTNPLSYVIETPESYYTTGSRAGRIMTRRTRRTDVIDSVLYESADSYAQLRSLYLQNRRFELGGPLGENYVDPYDRFGDTDQDPDDDPNAE